MSLTLRRTRADDSTREAELAQTLDVEIVHALLHRRGEPDLAVALLLRLAPDGARELATLLVRFRRRHARPGLWRSYRSLLDAAEARQVDLAVAFLRGAGQAGCRVYPDLNATAAPIAVAPPRQLYAVPHDAPQGIGATPDDTPADREDETPTLLDESDATQTAMEALALSPASCRPGCRDHMALPGIARAYQRDRPADQRRAADRDSRQREITQHGRTRTGTHPRLDTGNRTSPNADA